MSEIWFANLNLYAQNAAEGSQQPFWVQILPFALIIFVFYFLIIRPQQKKAKLQRELIASLKKGDKVITNSGIFGKIKSISKDNTTIDLEVAEKTTIRIKKEFVLSSVK